MKRERERKRERGQLAMKRETKREREQLDMKKVSVQPLVIVVAHKRPQSFSQKCRWQVTPKHAYTFDPTKSEWAGIVLELH